MCFCLFVCFLLPLTITLKNDSALLGPYFCFLVFTFFKVCFVPSIPHHICSSLGLQHKCPSETLSAEGGRLQVHCTLQERLANQGVQTQGLTNHTTEREGGGLTGAQSGIRSVLSADKMLGNVPHLAVHFSLNV